MPACAKPCGHALHNGKPNAHLSHLYSIAGEGDISFSVSFTHVNFVLGRKIHTIVHVNCLAVVGLLGWAVPLLASLKIIRMDRRTILQEKKNLTITYSVPGREQLLYVGIFPAARI